MEKKGPFGDTKVTNFPLKLFISIGTKRMRSEGI